MSSTKRTAFGSRCSPWDKLPMEIKIEVMDLVIKDNGSCGALASVSRDFQTLIESHTFRRITLTPRRLADFGMMTARNQHNVQNLWLSFKLQAHPCSDCLGSDDEVVFTSERPRGKATRKDCTIIANTIRQLLCVLSTWSLDNRRGKGLVLDLSAHCPSEREHAFSYLTSEPHWRAEDAAWIDRHEAILGDQSPVRLTRCERRGVKWHQIYSGFRDICPKLPPPNEHMLSLPLWWSVMPRVPVITTIMIRQQNRRRWSPAILGKLMRCCPNVQELVYEPWREWYQSGQFWWDACNSDFFESLLALRNLVVFENFSESYSFTMLDPRLREMTELSGVASKHLARASLPVEKFSVSFLSEAASFFDSLESAWVWPNLTSFAMTSRLLTETPRSPEVQRLLMNAAAVVPKMPKLRVMELWYGQEGRAMVFRYQPSRDGGRASVVCRGTEPLYLSDQVKQAWRDTAVQGHCYGVTFEQEPLDGELVSSHAAAISMLQLVNQVIQPISLQQTHQETVMRKRISRAGLST